MEIYKWYADVRQEYLKDYLEKSNSYNKFILTGTGGGVLAVLKFFNMYKDNNLFQTSLWILMSLLFCMGLLALLSYIFGAKSSEKFMDLLDETYLKYCDDQKIDLQSEVLNFPNRNKEFRFLKKIDKAIIIMIKVISVIVIAIAIQAIVIINNSKQGDKLMNDKTEKTITYSEVSKSEKVILNSEIFVPPLPPKTRKERETGEELEKE